jgi:TRAP transporter 4TM/12TM fusion protein|tara:strand:+ start:3181 stop:5142 length:1962 start_codon:yes stop_codon:yes gene_type:complete
MSGDNLRNPEQELTLEITEASLDFRKNPKDAVSTRTLTGSIDLIVTTLAMGLSLYALYWVVGIIQPQIYRVSFLLITLVLIFLIFPAHARWQARITWSDWLLSSAAFVALVWPIIDFDRFVYRAATPTNTDLTLGIITTLLVLEATRRTVGPILPVTAVFFLLYAYLGPFLELIGLELIAHRGYDIARLIGTLYMTLEGIFGVPLNVTATFIILFTVFGAVLAHSGAGQFFITWTMAAFGRSNSGAGTGRTVTLSGFLLGTVSGSGVATTVTLGSIAWPLLKRAGFSAEVSGGILSASGIGAIMAPPTMGAAAFLIAEFLQITYLQVIVMAIVPACLYYLSIVLMIEADARRLKTKAVNMAVPSVGKLTRQSGYQFLPLLAIVIFLLSGMTPFRAVFLSTMLAIGLSFIQRENALTPKRLIAALEAGGRGVLPIAATTATAGIIVGVVTLTGLGLKIAGIIVAIADGSVFLTVIYSAVAVWMLGLAVPVTASYIIAAVMIAPALTLVGVPVFAAHMFIFYYAVLSEVSPPTALSPFAAAAITGGNPFKTMMLTWKYTLPAFLVPFAFTLSPEGTGVLLQAPVAHIIRTVGTAVIGVSALAMGLGGWLVRPTTMVERVMAVAGGLLLFYATTVTDIIGLSFFGAAITLHLFRKN